MSYAINKADPQRRTIGGVEGREVATYIIDVEAHVSELAVGDVDEVIIRLNGRTLKRMHPHAARRAGVITEDAR